MSKRQSYAKRKTISPTLVLFGAFDNLTGPEWTEVKKRYELLKVIKSTSEKTIVKAQCKATGAIVLIKKVSDATPSFEKTRQLLREIQILRLLEARCGHLEYSPFAKLYDVLHFEREATADSDVQLTLFIITDMGISTLKEFLGKAHLHELDERLVRRIFYQLLQALRLLHSSGVVHRDVRPSTIILDANLNVKLTNFGLVRSMEEPKVFDNTQSSRNKIGFFLMETQHQRRHEARRLSIVMTNHTYMAPELLLKEKQYDSGVDMWGLGCTLAELLSCTVNYRLLGVDLKKRFLFQVPKSSFKEEAASRLKDQLQIKRILQTLGEQSRNDMSFISCEESKFFLNEAMLPVSKIDFQKEFQLSDKSLSKHLRSLLEFNFHYRRTAADILESKGFNSVRDANLEGMELGEVVLKVDHARVYDYEVGVPDVLDSSDLYRYIKKELA